jgi:hypothetical protein
MLNSVRGQDEYKLARTQGVHIGAMHPQQIWMHPLRFCKISKTNLLIRPLKKPATPYRIHVLPLLNGRGWKS